MARRVSALLQRNPNQTYFFAFGAGKGVSNTSCGMCRTRFRFSLSSQDFDLGQYVRWPLTCWLWTVFLNSRPNSIRIHHGSNSNLNLYFALNKVCPNTFWLKLRVCVFACNCKVEQRSGLLWPETVILSVLMCVYGEQFALFLCLKVKLEKKQDNNSVQWFPDPWHEKASVYTHTHAQESQLHPAPTSDEETMSCLFQLAFLANAANVSWMV